MEDINKTIAKKFEENQFHDVIQLCYENINMINLENKLNLIESYICIGDYNKSSRLIEEELQLINKKNRGEDESPIYELYALKTAVYFNENRNLTLLLFVSKNLKWLKYNYDVQNMFGEASRVIYKRLAFGLYLSFFVYLIYFVGLAFDINVYLDVFKNIAFAYIMSFAFLGGCLLFIKKQFKVIPR